MTIMPRLRNLALENTNKSSGIPDDQIMVNNLLDVFYTYCISCTLMQPIVNIILVSMALFTRQNILPVLRGFLLKVGFLTLKVFVLGFIDLNTPTFNTS